MTWWRKSIVSRFNNFTTNLRVAGYRINGDGKLFFRKYFTMKKLFIVLVFALASQLTKAQFSFYSTSTDLLNKSSQEATGHEEKKQLYHISFKDMILVHTIFDDVTGEVSDSQIYQIVETKEEGTDKVVFQAKSGVSGKTYEYRLHIPEGQNASLLLVFAGEDFDLRYNGVVSALKTIKQ